MIETGNNFNIAYHLPLFLDISWMGSILLWPVDTLFGANADTFINAGIHSNQ